MRRLIFVAAFAVAAFALPTFAQNTSLNGTWKLNTSKSNFGQFPPPQSETDVITVSGSDFKEQVTSVGQNGTQNYVRGCATDGKEVAIPADDPRSHLGAVTITKVQCAWDGSSLVVTETANLRGNDLTDKLTFSTSADGKTMTMASHITSAAINADRSMVYDAGDSSAAAPGGVAPSAGAAAMIHAGGSAPNLSGTWALNLSKSNFGQIPGPASQVDTIEDSEPSIKIVEDQKGGMMGDMNITTNLSTDGKETTSPGMGGAEVKSTAHWDGATLVVNSKTSFQGADVAIKDSFSVSPDGQTLTEATHIESGMGNFDTTSVFDKK